MEEKKISRNNIISVLVTTLALTISWGCDFYALSQGRLTSLSLFLTFIVTIFAIIVFTGVGISTTLGFAAKILEKIDMQLMLVDEDDEDEDDELNITQENND